MRSQESELAYASLFNLFDFFFKKLRIYELRSDRADRIWHYNCLDMHGLLLGIAGCHALFNSFFFLS